MSNGTLVKHPTNLPSRKVGSGGIGGAISIIAVWALNEYANADIDAEIPAAIATVVTFVFAYFAKERVR